MKVGRFRLKLVHHVVMWTYVICQSFRFNDLFLVEFWISSPQGSPEADFQCNFDHFSISLLATYNCFRTKPKPYLKSPILRCLWVKTLAHGKFLYALAVITTWSHLKHMERNRKWPVFKTAYFPCLCFMS